MKWKFQEVIEVLEVSSDKNYALLEQHHNFVNSFNRFLLAGNQPMADVYHQRLKGMYTTLETLGIKVKGVNS